MTHKDMFNLPESPTGMRIVSMIEYRGKVIVATERGVYMKNDKDEFERLKFAPAEEQPE